MWRERRPELKRATLGIVIRNNEILLGTKKRGEIGSGTLNGPGGKVDLGEDGVACLVREGREELGIELFPELLEKIAVITFYARGEPDFLVVVFRTKLTGREPVETADMVPHWFPLDEIPYKRMLESDKEWFPRAIRGEHFFANVYTRRGQGDLSGSSFCHFTTRGNPRVLS